MKKLLIFSALVFALSGCVTELSTARRDIASDLTRSPDNAGVLSDKAGLVRRDGDILRVRVRRGWRTFVDRGVCEGEYTCERHRAHLIWHGRYVGVKSNYGESGGYLLVDTQKNVVHELGGEPHFSPSGTKFIVAETDAYEAYAGPAVWAVDSSGALAMAKSFESTVSNPDFVAWRGENEVDIEGSTDAKGKVKFRIFDNGTAWQIFPR